jgi:hypothetical protein
MCGMYEEKCMYSVSITTLASLRYRWMQKFKPNLGGTGCEGADYVHEARARF